MGAAKFTHGLGIGDVNGDGKLDLLEAKNWWEHTDSGTWKKHPFNLTGGGGAQNQHESRTPLAPGHDPKVSVKPVTPDPEISSPRQGAAPAGDPPPASVSGSGVEDKPDEPAAPQGSWAHRGATTR